MFLLEVHVLSLMCAAMAVCLWKSNLISSFLSISFFSPSFLIAARQESSHVQPHPPHLATSEQPMVRGSRDGASPQSSHPRVSKNGSEFCWWVPPPSFFFSFLPWAILNPRAKAHQKADVVPNQCSLSLKDNCRLVVLAHHITISTVAWNWN